MLDDSDFALEVNVMMLERRGYEARGCHDLEEVRSAAEEGFVPDAIITDVGLGMTSVDEACETLRASFGDDVPVLLFSGREDDDLAELVARLPVNGSINKADRPDVVVDKLQAAIDAAQSA